MSDPGKVIVALGFFSSVVYIVRLITLGAASYRKQDVAARPGLVLDEDRMARLEQAVEAIALEVERISEGQRFTTKLLAERAPQEQAPARRAASPVEHRTPH